MSGCFGPHEVPEAHSEFRRIQHGADQTKQIRKGLGIQFEYTSPHTPQFNGRVERTFPYLFGIIRAMLNAAELTVSLRNLVWAEAAAHGTLLRNLLVRSTSPHPAVIKFMEEETPGWRGLHPFGEIAIVSFPSTQNSMQCKLNDRGRPCMFLSLGRNQPSDTCRFLDLHTRSVISSRDVGKWLDVFYGTFMQLPPEDYTFVEPEEDTDSEDEPDPREPDEEEEDPDVVYLEVAEDTGIVHLNGQHPITVQAATAPATVTPPVSPSTQGGPSTPQASASLQVPTTGPRELRYLEAPRTAGTTRSGRAFSRVYFGVSPRDSAPQFDFAAFAAVPIPSLLEYLQESVPSPLTEQGGLRRECAYSAREEDMDPNELLPEQYKDVFEAPARYEQAWDHPDPFQREKWREAIEKEFSKMNTLNVWIKIKRADMPRDRRCVKHKWVFDIKRNGVFRARLVACGYSQIAGVDFTDIYSPVVNDITVRLVLVIMLIHGLDCCLVDVETAFLHGVLSEEEAVYMDCPRGMEHEAGECLRLLKTIYGLKQSARAFFQTFKQSMRDAGFEPSTIDPCLFIKADGARSVYAVVWVDDCFFAGPRDGIEEAIEKLSESYKLKIEWNVQDYLSCELAINKEEGTAWIGQPHMYKKLEKTFEGMLPSQTFTTPGTPRYQLTKATDEDCLSPEEQTLYRSGTGQLLYLQKYTRPDISNAVRELTKGMSKATSGTMKELKRVVKFVLDTKHLGLRFQPKKMTIQVGKWTVVVYSDSDWGADVESRKSITGYAVFFMDCLVSWKSKQQSVIALSSAESEYYALTEAAKEVKFIVQLLQEMGVPVELPVVCRVDNKATIYMSENTNSSSRTRHIDIKARWITEQVEDGFVKIIYVKTKENLSDGYMKNVTTDVYEMHTPQYMGSKGEDAEEPKEDP